MQSTTSSWKCVTSTTASSMKFFIAFLVIFFVMIAFALIGKWFDFVWWLMKKVGLKSYDLHFILSVAIPVALLGAAVVASR